MRTVLHTYLRKGRFLTWILVGGTTLFFVLFSIIGLDLYRLFYQPMVLQKNESIIIHLNKYTTASSFARALQSMHLIQPGRLFLLLIRAQGLSQQLKAGIYQIRAGESAQQFLYRVVAGDVLTETFRIIEGTTQKQVAANLKNATYLTYDPTDWSKLAGIHPNMEGLLFADTYHYDAGTQSLDLLARAHENLEHYLEISWQQRSVDLPYKTPYELLIAASILEKEASLPAERRLIAGVIVNRLRKFMPLQMDPTVIYAQGSHYTGKLTRGDLNVDSPYNSYRYRGLPPTPISMVGKDALDAAAHPQSTDYLYFVARGDGSHQFSATYDQQKQAIARYLKRDS